MSESDNSLYFSAEEDNAERLHIRLAGFRSVKCPFHASVNSESGLCIYVTDMDIYSQVQSMISMTKLQRRCPTVDDQFALLRCSNYYERVKIQEIRTNDLVRIDMIDQCGNYDVQSSELAFCENNKLWNITSSKFSVHLTAGRCSSLGHMDLLSRFNSRKWRTIGPLDNNKCVEIFITLNAPLLKGEHFSSALKTTSEAFVRRFCGNEFRIIFTILCTSTSR
ncbi:hypothetical protein GJ496_007733 [Pomphorhynchus laevis]|nr:hypothetical protein GJ496_007733 [Pomphorhynchus laevis]